ncbi:S-layer homology domain-containing protein [Cohnella mopanensis]|uniref:S-layer homology domain-containing protein n=1 Tax=Cohnella mopanensis TaxID=2911966 RepID=UPI001EF7EBDC|nr:S-layer homology domain-containing protein [Cohnella mopanensis]
MRFKPVVTILLSLAVLSSIAIAPLELEAKMTIDPQIKLIPNKLPIELKPIQSDASKPPAFATLQWQYDLPAPVFDPAVGENGTVYLSFKSAPNASEMGMRALARRGDTKWVYKTNSAPSGSPTVGPDGYIYLATDDNQLLIIQPDGVLKQTLSLESTMLGSPAFGTDGTLFVGLLNGEVKAFDSVLGTLKWKFATNGSIVTSLAASSDGTVYAMSQSGYLFAIKPNGTLKWKNAVAIDTKENYSSPVLGPDGTIYAAIPPKNNGLIVSWNTDGSQKWSYGPLQVGAPSVGQNSNVYFVMATRLIKLDQNGKNQSSINLDGYAQQPAIDSDGTIYVLMNDGTLIALNPTGETKWLYFIDPRPSESSISKPIAGKDNTVYVQAGGSLFAIRYGVSPVSSVTLDRNELALSVGESKPLMAKVLPDNAGDKIVSWSSNDRTIATVDDKGNVTGVAAGTTQVIVKTEEGGFIATCTVTVTGGPLPPVVTAAFTDTNGHWAKDDIQKAVSLGIAKGYTDGTFKPDGNITRAEFAVMLMNGLGPTDAGTTRKFKDSQSIGAWASKAVSQAAVLGIISGYPDGTFRPNENITHAEMAAMVFKASKLLPNKETVTSYADDADIPKWARAYVSSAEKAGIIIVGGKGDNKFAPLAPATRAESVSSIVRLQALLK